MSSYCELLLSSLRESPPARWTSTGAGFFSLQPHLVGYAAIWNTRFLEYRGVREMIQPFAFQGDVRRQPRLSILMEHDECRVLGSLDLVDIDSTGLWLEVAPNGTESSRFQWGAISSGALCRWSIGYRVPRLDRRGDITVSRARLDEISLVADPRCPGTQAQLRPRWSNADRLRNLLIVDNQELADDPDYLAAKAILRRCELSGSPPPRDVDSLMRRVQLFQHEIKEPRHAT